MEFWPKKKPSKKKEPLVLESTFGPPGFSEWEVSQYPRNLDHVDSPESFIETVDFDTLNNIFDTLSQKSEGATGVSTTGHRVTPESIDFDVSDEGEERDAYGRAHVQTGKITLIWESKKEGESSASQTIQILHTLMHEATHVRGGFVSEDWERGRLENGDWEKGFIDRKGLLQTSYSTSSGLRKGGLSLNEAITENIANEVLVEYLIRTGNGGYAKDSKISKDLGLGSYVMDRLVLAVVIDSLAEKLHVHRDEIWKGFVQAYMNGNTELWSLLSELSFELQERPEIAELVSELGSSVKSLSMKEDITFESVLTRFSSDPHRRLAVLERVGGARDFEKFKNVLAIH